MITLKTYERTPTLAELKVSYRRGRGRDDRQLTMPWVITSAVSCVDYLRSVWDKDTIDLREEFLLLCLNTANEVLGWVKLSTGGLDAAWVDPRIVFAVALQTASGSIIVAHNHPSGQVQPSQADIEMTRRISEGAKILGIRFLDHVIVSREEAFSFSENGLL